jgi:poly-gamma-glutamate synthesis protein (capsule biosynthesis protein)
MPTTLILTGDVNLMNVTDPDQPFRRVRDEFQKTDLVFSNLECCLYEPPHGHSTDNEGFFVAPRIGGEALRRAGIHVVGIANNVNYGEEAIKTSVAQLDAHGIMHTGAGANIEVARAPVIVERNGLRCGFLQRTSVYWPTHHEARPHAAGVAVIRGNTAYQLPMHKTRPEIPPMNRPGLPPVIKTWAEPEYLQAFVEDIAALRKQVDVLVASCHWGLWEEVLDYMTEIGRAAVDAGADIVMGHGPHYSMPVERYRGKPIFYGLGSFSFHTGHGGRKHGDWLGMMVRARLEGKSVSRAAFQFVRHNQDNETVLCTLAQEREAFDTLSRSSEPLGAKLRAEGDEMVIEAAGG